MKAVRTIDALKIARKYVNNPNTWTTGACFRDIDNIRVNYPSQGVKFCAAGAIGRAYYDLTHDDDSALGISEGVAYSETNMGNFNTKEACGETVGLSKALRKLARQRGYDSLFKANDSSRKVAIAIIDDAIAELESNA